MTEAFIDKELLARLEGYHKLLIGFSGGLDSTVLLHYLSAFPQLKNKLKAVHVNHGLSKNARHWQQHCHEFCESRRLAIHSESIQLSQTANIEEAAREARYQVFASLLSEDDALLLGHHQDDQAETLLFQLLRGAGVDGLAGMQAIGELGKAALIRPFLHLERRQLNEYAQSHHLDWVEDESNEYINYSRNYIRHEVMPVLKKNWPSATKNLARTADHCQQARRNLDDLASLDAANASLTSPVLSMASLMNLKRDRLSNLLRLWLKNQAIQLPSSATFQRLIDEVIYSRKDANAVVQWGNVALRRYQQDLYLFKVDEILSTKPLDWSNFPQAIHLSPGLGCLNAEHSKQGLLIPKGSKIDIGFRKGGECIHWHGQTKALKKLFQQWQVPPWLRDRIPLIYINNELAQVVGYALSDSFYSEQGDVLWSITQESPRPLP